MRRFTTLLALAVACSLGISAAYAGPGCCASKSKKSKLAKASKSACSAKKSCDSKAEFPKLVRMVGDKTYECPYTAKKMAKDSDAKVIFAVAGETYECEKSAMSAYADASEKFVNRFMNIACVVDGKVMYCDDKAAGCSSAKAKVAKAGAKGCCQSSCASKAKLAKGETKICPLSGKKITSDEDSAKLAKAGGKGSCASKAKLAKAEGKGKTCPITGKLIESDEKKGCDKAKLAKAEGKGCCASKAKLAKAESKGKTCPITGKLIKSDDKKSCDKADAKAAIVKAYGKSKSNAASCCKADKFLVAGREFDKWEDAVKARDEAMSAVAKVKMTYLVDGKAVDCCSKVCPKAKEAGKVKFVVGEDNMDCEYKARVALAKAKYDAVKNSNNKSLAKS